jgi:hypothetical protein
VERRIGLIRDSTGSREVVMLVSFRKVPASSVLPIVLTAGYVAASLACSVAPDVGSVLRICICGVGIASGATGVRASFSRQPALRAGTPRVDLRTHVLVGGVATIWVAATTAWAVLQPLFR